VPAAKPVVLTATLPVKGVEAEGGVTDSQFPPLFVEALSCTVIVGKDTAPKMSSGCAGSELPTAPLKFMFVWLSPRTPGGKTVNATLIVCGELLAPVPVIVIVVE
jgi:hypothetical protein